MDWDNVEDVEVTINPTTSYYTPIKNGIFFISVQTNQTNIAQTIVTDVLSDRILAFFYVTPNYWRDSAAAQINANRQIKIEILNGGAVTYSYFVPFK